MNVVEKHYVNIQIYEEIVEFVKMLFYVNMISQRLLVMSARIMIFAHATKTGKAQTALFELARMVIHGHLMQRILTPMRSALVLVFVIERLASASALQVSLAMLANAVS